MGLDVSANLIVGFPVEGVDLWKEEELDKMTCNIRQEDASIATGRAHETTNLNAAFCEVCGSKLKRVTVATPTKEFELMCKEIDLDLTPAEIYEGWEEGYSGDGGLGLWQSKSSAYNERDIFGIMLGRTSSHRYNGEGFEAYKPQLDKAFSEMEAYHKTLKATGTIRLYVALNVSA